VGVENPRELVEAFAEAVPPALREMAGVEAVVRESRPADGADAFGDLSATVRLTTAGGEWRLGLSFPQRTAAELARRVLAGTTDAVTPELIADCMGEVANVVAGQAKALLFGTASHFTLSTPVVLTGSAEAADVAWVIQFDSDAGEFALYLCPSRVGESERSEG
jgi:CheY-specific phosphatase CheX